MALFKDVKKPVIKKLASVDQVSPLRPRFVEKQPPCTERCPAGSDVRGWLRDLAATDAGGGGGERAYERAWVKIAETNPFPSTMGRICPHPCESGCHRSAKDGAVAINVLEGFVGDLALARKLELPRLTDEVRPEKVVIVGAGPAGLSCAYQLARRGYRPVVLEARERAGGRLRDAIRTGRLKAETLDAEARRIEDLGVEIRVGMPVDDRVIEALERDYRAVYMSVGRDPGTALARIQPRPAANAAVGLDAETGAESMLLFADHVSHHGLVAAAIARGRLAAIAIDGWLTRRPAHPLTSRPLVPVERLKLGWYKAAPRHNWKTVPGGQGSGEWQALEVAVSAEAARCLSCGTCMDCDNCWMYCTSSGFERLPKGQHYRIKLELCNGCRKCGEECPTGYIDLS